MSIANTFYQIFTNEIFLFYLMMISCVYVIYVSFVKPYLQKESLVNMQNVNAKNNALQSKSTEYSDNLKSQITVSIDDLALSTYSKNYLKIIDDMDNLFTMKMLENLLVIDYSDDEQMMKRVNRIGRISEAKKSLTEVKDLVHNFTT
jgi:hypothetical protein